MVPLGDTLEDLDADGVVLETLRRDQGGPERLIEVLAAAFVHRLPVTWTGLLPGRHVDLPTYAFQHGRYWLDEPARSVEPDGLGLAAAGHPLLGAVVESAQDGRVMFTGRLSRSSHPWLAGHAVLGTVIVPGTALLEMAAWAGGEVCRPDIEELTLHAPLVLPDATAVRIQVTLDPPDDTATRAIAIHSRPEDAPADHPWTSPPPAPSQATRRGRAPASWSRGRPSGPRPSTPRACTIGWPRLATATVRRSEDCGRRGGTATNSSPRSPAPHRRPRAGRL